MTDVWKLTTPLRDYVGALAEHLDRLFPRRSTRRRATLRHALEFSTWRSLSRLTAGDRQAADVAASWIRESS